MNVAHTHPQMRPRAPNFATVVTFVGSGNATELRRTPAIGFSSVPPRIGLLGRAHRGCLR